MAKALLVLGLGYGDEGKGSLVHYLTQRDQAGLVVRFNGGAQAAHNVVLEDGREHTFHQFGSGTLVGANTFLSRYMLVNPVSAWTEAKKLLKLGIDKPMSRLYVDGEALVTTPYHVHANRIRESARKKRHGSCGMGIGETMKDSLDNPEEVLRVEDFLDLPLLREKLVRLQQKYRQELAIDRRDDNEDDWGVLMSDGIIDNTVACYQDFAEDVNIVEGTRYLHEQCKKDGTIIFEGAQGVLLDQDFGFHPYTTWTDCTFGNVEKLLAPIPAELRTDVTKIGVLRGYGTRHGAGPFKTEDATIPMPGDEHNCKGAWQKEFRLGHFDLVTAQYALNVVGGVDYLALTCLDHLSYPVKMAVSYAATNGIETLTEIRVNRPADLKAQEALGEMLSGTRLLPNYIQMADVDTFVSYVERCLEVPIKLRSYGPQASDKRPR